MIQYLYIKVIFPIKSFLFNCIFWVPNTGSFKQTRRKKQELLASIKTAADIPDVMKGFTWKEDKSDWEQWVVTLLHNDKHGDCEDAANLARCLFKKVGVKGSVYNLYNMKTKKGHAIYVSDDKEIMVSNNKVEVGQWVDSQIKIYFNLKYSRIIK
jgi:hypothetical protein